MIINLLVLGGWKQADEMKLAMLVVLVYSKLCITLIVMINSIKYFNVKNNWLLLFKL